MTTVNAEQMKAARAKIQQMNTDKALLRYLVTNSEQVNSTVVRDPLGCKYIYVKPGMYDDVLAVSNIDFVMAIYNKQGIGVKKHISHLGNEDVEVLYISAADILKLNKIQERFLYQTAPEYCGMGANSNYYQRSTAIVNDIYRNKVRAQQK